MRFIAFDTETTGFLPGIDNVVEIGAVRFTDGKPDAVFSTLINPLRSMPEAAARVNGITDEMLAEKPTIDHILPSFAEFCGEDLIIAHNAQFDFGMLAAEIKKHETPAPRGVLLDTLAMSRKVFQGLQNYKLGTLIQHLGIKGGGFHRAEEDAAYCGQLFLKICEKIAVGGQPPELENLLNLCDNKALKFPQIERKPKQLDLLSI